MRSRHWHCELVRPDLTLTSALSRHLCSSSSPNKPLKFSTASSGQFVLLLMTKVISPCLQLNKHAQMPPKNWVAFLHWCAQYGSLYCLAGGIGIGRAGCVACVISFSAAVSYKRGSLAVIVRQLTCGACSNQSSVFRGYLCQKPSVAASFAAGESWGNCVRTVRKTIGSMMLSQNDFYFSVCN